MAKIEVTIRTPKPPNALTVEMPGARRGTPLPLNSFSNTELDSVIKDWGAALKARAAEMRKEAHDAEDETGDIGGDPGGEEE